MNGFSSRSPIGFVLASWVLLTGLGSDPSVEGAPPQRRAKTKYVEDVEFALRQLSETCAVFIDQKKIDWPRVTKEFSKEARNVRTDSEHLLLLWRLVARLRDGHAQVRPLPAGKSVKLPSSVTEKKVGPGLFLTVRDDRVFVKNAWGGAAKAGLRPGMEIVKVGRTAARKWLDRRVEEHRDLIGFSTDAQALFYACHWGLVDKPGTGLKLVLRAGKKRRGGVIKFDGANQVPNGPAFTPDDIVRRKDIGFCTTAAGWGYVHVRRCPGNLPEVIDEALEELADVPGLILDFRGNSGGGFDHDDFLGRFIPKGKSIRFAKRYRGTGEQPYGGPIVVIVDATVRSAGETGAGIFKEDGRAYMIGESPTAGMSASKTTIELPSGLFSLYVSVRSNKLRFNGGKGIEGIGVIPHEIVPFEPRDLAQKKDTLILRAEELLKNFPQSKVPYVPSKFGWRR